jgi:hypothetical protein
MAAGVMALRFQMYASTDADGLYGQSPLTKRGTELGPYTQATKI